MIISIYVSIEVHSLLAILNFVACAVWVIIRVYHWKKQKTEIRKLTATGFSCMLAALLYCAALMNTQIGWYFGDEQYCTLSMKLTTATYASHRVLLYIFIILRLEVVNKAHFMSSKIIDAGKVVISVYGIVIIATSTALTKGVANQYFSCNYQVSFGVLVTVFVIDMLLCIGGTWMFIRPLRRILRTIESESFRNFLKKTLTWSIVSLVSTVIAILTLATIAGAGGVVGFDCSITSFCLLVMMAPAVPEVPSKSYSDSGQKASLENEKIESVVQRNPSSKREPSNEILDRYYEEVLRERALQQV